MLVKLAYEICISSSTNEHLDSQVFLTSLSVKEIISTGRGSSSHPEYIFSFITSHPSVPYKVGSAADTSGTNLLRQHLDVHQSAQPLVLLLSSNVWAYAHYLMAIHSTCMQHFLVLIPDPEDSFYIYSRPRENK